MNSIKKNKKLFSSFIIFGPFFGTLFLMIITHSDIYLYDPIRFLKGMVTPSIIFQMLVNFIFIIPFGYWIGIMPAYLTDRLYENFVKDKLPQSNLLHAVLYGGGLSLVWAPLIVILSSFTVKPWTIFIEIKFFLFLPTTIICTLIEWRHLK